MSLLFVTFRRCRHRWIAHYGRKTCAVCRKVKR